MKKVLITLLLVPALRAATDRNAQVAARLVTALLPLQSVIVEEEPLESRLYTRPDVLSHASAGQNSVMKILRNDLTGLQFTMNSETPHRSDEVIRGFQPFCSPDLEFKLTRVLAGKPLAESSLLPLAEAIVAMLADSVACRNTGSCELDKSEDLRHDSEQAATALNSLGVAQPELAIVMNALLSGAVSAARPPLRQTYK